MLQERRGFGFVSVSGRIFAIGGLSIDNEVLDTVECYDPLKNSWEVIAPLYQARLAHSVIVHKNRLYVIGGLSEDGSAVYAIEYYDAHRDIWIVV